MSWLNASRMEMETSDMDAMCRSQYMSGVLAALGGKKRPSSVCGSMGFDLAVDGKRFAERHGLDMLENSPE